MQNINLEVSLLEEQFNILSYLGQYKSNYKDYNDIANNEAQEGHNNFLLREKTAENEDSSLEEWKKVCLECRSCSLREGASGVVFGEGDLRAGLMFIGEGPGGEEDKLGRPFVGKAGQLLNRILAAAGLQREEVYIANIVKCRPPDNRAPQREEIETCLPLLEKQIELIDPLLMVCLGAVASKTLLRPNFSITRERGNWNEFGGRPLMPTFHPAALLRDPSKKRPVWEDMLKVMERYRELSEKER